MLRDEQVIRFIFGFKVRHLRQSLHYSYQELANKTGLSTSYLNDIEKGKRYPKPDKITALAGALGVDYNYLVSTTASKKVQPIIDLLTSKIFRLFPLDDFGISVEKLLELFTHTPNRVNAFISTIFKIARNYQVGEKQFYLEALRSYQDMHNNHFPKLEEAAVRFCEEYSIENESINPSYLADQLLEIYDVKTDRKGLSKNSELSHIRSYFNPLEKTLFLRSNLSYAQENFLLAREIGFHYLELEERPLETTITQIDSFEILLNNYKASHFAAALLMNAEKLAIDLKEFARENTWQPDLFISLLEKYKVTPETLLQRLTNILPHHFGLEDLFFMRLSSSEDLKKFSMNKDLHLSQLHSPYNNELNENYCHRWISVTSIKELRTIKKKKNQRRVIADAQISKYWNTDKEYLCLTYATGDFDNTARGASVTLGLLVTPHVKSIFHFLSDPNLKIREVHTTCERCGIANCEARVSPPFVLEDQDQEKEILRLLKEL